MSGLAAAWAAVVHALCLCCCGCMSACILHLLVRAVTVVVQVLPYWTKASLSNLAAVVCWRHAASLSPASIRVTQSADGSQDANPGLITAFSCLRTPATIVPLEVSSQLPAAATPQSGFRPVRKTLQLPAHHGCQVVMLLNTGRAAWTGETISLAHAIHA